MRAISMGNNKIEFIAVDLQNEFTHPKGKYCSVGNSVKFIQSVLFPYLSNHHLKVNEVISDYRQPRHSKSGSYCIPGDFGYESIIPKELKKADIWVKSMHNPTWIRTQNDQSSFLDYPKPEPQQFSDWLKRNIGGNDVIIFGETLDVCVYALAQELYYRGYRVYILYEATDPMNERLDHKDSIAYHTGLSVYAKLIHFDEMKTMIGTNEGTNL